MGGARHFGRGATVLKRYQDVIPKDLPNELAA